MKHPSLRYDMARNMATTWPPCETRPTLCRRCCCAAESKQTACFRALLFTMTFHAKSIARLLQNRNRRRSSSFSRQVSVLGLYRIIRAEIHPHRIGCMDFTPLLHAAIAVYQPTDTRPRCTDQSRTSSLLVAPFHRERYAANIQSLASLHGRLKEKLIDD